MEDKAAAQPGKLEELTVSRMTFVTPNYFKAMGIPILRCE